MGFNKDSFDYNNRIKYVVLYVWLDFLVIVNNYECYISFFVKEAGKREEFGNMESYISPFLQLFCSGS